METYLSLLIYPYMYSRCLDAGIIQVALLVIIIALNTDRHNGLLDQSGNTFFVKS